MTQGDKRLSQWRHSGATMMDPYGAGMGQAQAESGSRYDSQKRSPIGLGAAIAIHVAAAGVFLLVPAQVYEPYVPDILIGTNIPVDPPPPEVTPDTLPKTDNKTPFDPVIVPDTVVKVPDDIVLPRVPDIVIPPLSGDGGAGVVPPSDPPPIHTPVMVEPQIDGRALKVFQPDYPGAMIRLGEEGQVTVRVTVGADGRVTDIARVAASNDAFWIVTERHARKAWRFRPATRDGVAVSGTRVLTVYFKLEGQ